MFLFRALLRTTLAILWIAYGYGTGQAATISAGTNGIGIAIEGEIKPGDFQKYLQFRVSNLTNSKVSVTVVFLNSPGGSVKEALKFAEAFSSNLFSTFVLDGKLCFSACTIIWAGGVERTLQGTGRLGFHRLSITGKEIDVQKTKEILTPASSKVTEFFKDVGLPNPLIEKMNETAPTDLFIVNQRWLEDHKLDLTIRYQPTFLDVVEKRCGEDPTTALMKNNLSFSPEVKDRFGKWLDCAEEVKEVNRALRIKEIVTKDNAEARDLQQIGQSIARTKWAKLISTDDMVAYINKDTQRWSAATTQFQSITDYKSIKSSIMDYKIVDCDTGTVANIEGSTSVMCDGNLCKTPTAILKNESSKPKKAPSGSFNALFVESVCKSR